MASEIRSLLSAAQSAEVKGDTVEAVRLLREAAAFYRDRKLVTRAMQMLRHARRLEGHEDPGPPLDGFAPRELMGEPDDFDGPTGEVDWSNEEDEAPDDDDEDVFGFDGGGHERVLTPADPSLDAWCSFCCRPARDVGPLTAGPTNAFICAACTQKSAEILELKPVQALVKVIEGLLGAQQAVLDAYNRRKPRLALIIGPEGAGKSTLLRAISAPKFDDAVPEATTDGVIAIRGLAPTPALVLAGEHGPEPIFDTDALVSATGLSKTLLTRVDAVFALPALESTALNELAMALLSKRGISLPGATVSQLVAVAEKSGRSAHELVALVARIPAGTYQSP